MAAEESSWRTSNFRQSVVAKIEEAIRSSGMPTTKNSMEMENHVFQKAKTKEEYLGFVARLILHVREMNSKKSSGLGGPAGGGGQNMQDPINALQTLARQGTGNQMMGLVPPQGPNQVTATNLLQTLNQRPGNQQRMQSPVQRKRKANFLKATNTNSSLQDFMKNVFVLQDLGKSSMDIDQIIEETAEELDDIIDRIKQEVKQEVFDLPSTSESSSLRGEDEEFPAVSPESETLDSQPNTQKKHKNKEEHLEIKLKKSKLELEIMEKTSYERSLSILKLERELGIAASKYTRELLGMI